MLPSFTGVFDGNGHVISGLTIDGASYYMGLFGRLESGAEVKNLGVVDLRVTGRWGYVGGLVGQNYDGAVINCYTAGRISGGGNVGGLVGGIGGSCFWGYS